MYEIIDKIILFLCAAAYYIGQYPSIYAIVPVILVLCLSSLSICLENGFLRLAGILLFAVLCIWLPEYMLFLPLLCYDIFHTKYQYGILPAVLLFVVSLNHYSTTQIVVNVSFLAIAFLLKYKTDRQNTLQKKYNDLRDTSVEISIQLKEKNRTLLQNQDALVNLAALNERNRISKELHDNIGHLLSRSLLQVGALLAITKEKPVTEGLNHLKESLSGGMDEIRTTIHQMYDESIDLYTQLNCLVKDFSFCQINFEYDIKVPPALPLKHCLIAIVKEALANVIRHSNATRVSVLLREHPAIYQLIIQDNGTLHSHQKNRLKSFMEHPELCEGMGLRNIMERVKGFHGILNISMENGFRLFITIEKGNVPRTEYLS